MVGKIDGRVMLVGPIQRLLYGALTIYAGAQVNVPYHSKGSVVSVIDPAEHSKRRRVWDRAFTPNAVKSYEPMLQIRLDQLMAAFNQRAGSPIDIAEWFGLFSIDFMGDFAFGGMFNNMVHGEDVQGLHKSMVQSLHMIEIMGSVPWVRPIVQALPSTKAKEIQQMGLSVARERKKQGSQIRDLFYYLVSVCVLLFAPT
jgi:cytochrome P450